jgi:hypothetical protein
MIRDEIKKIENYYEVHTFTQGKCGREITQKPEWDMWHHRSKEELKNLRNAIDYILNYDHPKQKVKEEWD